MKARAYLRAITRDAHARVDNQLSSLDLTDLHGYAGFLAMQAAAFLPIERALDEAGAVQLLPDWPQRRRGDALLADLAALGISADLVDHTPRYDRAAAIWGGLYVLEGSRLGGTIIQRAVPKSYPQFFLSHVAPKSSWSIFIAALERNLDKGVAVEEAGASAIETFACFERSVAKGVVTQ